MSLLNIFDSLRRDLTIGEFQSLFSWMSLLNLAEYDRQMSEYQFQSLFSWMSLLNVVADERDTVAFPVSILVLVDVALEPMVGLVTIGLTRGFNPCSRGCRS